MKYNEVEAVLRLALDALEKIYIAPEHEEYIRVWWPACEEAITALRQALDASTKLEQAQPSRSDIKQEPVAQCTNSDSWNCKYCSKVKTCEAINDHRNFASPPTQQSCSQRPAEEGEDTCKWVGLTFAEICECESEYANVFARNIEAKLKEKNLL
jgi:predicted  nucleic acid-binding Zn ribbon protein